MKFAIVLSSYESSFIALGCETSITQSYLLVERSFMKPGHCPPGWIRVPVPIKNSQKQEVEI